MKAGTISHTDYSKVGNVGQGFSTFTTYLFANDFKRFDLVQSPDSDTICNVLSDGKYVKNLGYRFIIELKSSHVDSCIPYTELGIGKVWKRY